MCLPLWMGEDEMGRLGDGHDPLYFLSAPLLLPSLHTCGRLSGLGVLVLFLVFRFILFYVHECFVCLNVCVPRHVAHESQKGLSDPLELKLWVVMSHNVGAGSQTSVFYNSSKCSEGWAISPSKELLLWHFLRRLSPCRSVVTNLACTDRHRNHLKTHYFTNSFTKYPTWASFSGIKLTS